MNTNGSMKSDVVMDAEKMQLGVRPGQIFGLIQKAMQKVGAIGKDSDARNVSGKVMYKFRGIDAVYNALNPVMSDLGLFLCPEVIDHQREERKSTTGATLIYSVLTIRYTIFAPDGSYISCTVVGEGMDSGDKASNKAMSVAMKYAMFQLLMIPTEDLADPDAEVHEVAPRAVVTPAAQVRPRETPQKAENAAPAVQVSKTDSLPPVQAQNTPQNVAQDAPQATAPQNQPTEAQVYLLKAMKQLREDRGITARENNEIFAKQFKALVEAGIAPNKKQAEYTLKEAEDLIDAMYKNFTIKGTEIKGK